MQNSNATAFLQISYYYTYIRWISKFAQKRNHHTKQKVRKFEVSTPSLISLAKAHYTKIGDTQIDLVHYRKLIYMNDSAPSSMTSLKASANHLQSTNGNKVTFELLLLCISKLRLVRPLMTFICSFRSTRCLKQFKRIKNPFDIPTIKFTLFSSSGVCRAEGGRCWASEDKSNSIFNFSRYYSLHMVFVKFSFWKDAQLLPPSVE